jgi:hypothetical protein
LLVLQILKQFANPFFGERAAERPTGARDLAVLVVLYSPGHFVRPALNALLLYNRLEALGVPVYKLEVALGSDHHVLPSGKRTVLLRSSSCLFQKERLLNVLASRVPPTYKKLLFLDGDVLLGNADRSGPHWYDVLSLLLDHYEVVQPFDVSGHLDLSFSRVNSVKCSVFHANKRSSLDSQIPAQKLHTGLAWAFSRAWLDAQGGLFDAAIHGGGDSVNAAAFGGYSVCMPDSVDGEASPACLAGGGRILVTAYASEYVDYAARAAAHAPRVASAHTLVAMDMWHGAHSKRQYSARLAHFAGVRNLSELVRTDAQGIYEFVPDSSVAAEMNATKHLRLLPCAAR